jgi:hypothetical protein
MNHKYSNLFALSPSRIKRAIVRRTGAFNNVLPSSAYTLPPEKMLVKLEEAAAEAYGLSHIK